MLEGLQHLVSLERPAIEILRDFADIFIVTFIIYRALLVLKGTRAMQMGIGFVAFGMLYLLAKYAALATLMQARLPLDRALATLADVAEDGPRQDFIRKVLDRVRSGATLADALKKHPKVFDNLFVNMVEAGEAGGILDVILLRLATYIEKAEALRRKIKGAMTYPIVVLSVAVSTTRHTPRMVSTSPSTRRAIASRSSSSYRPCSVASIA